MKLDDRSTTDQITDAAHTDDALTLRLRSAARILATGALRAARARKSSTQTSVVTDRFVVDLVAEYPLIKFGTAADRPGSPESATVRI